MGIIFQGRLPIGENGNNPIIINIINILLKLLITCNLPAGAHGNGRPTAPAPTKKGAVLPPLSCLGFGPPPGGRLDPSGASEADGYLVSLHQDRHPPLSRCEAQHLFQSPGILPHVPVNDPVPLRALGLPGLVGIGSGPLAEDGDLLGHRHPPNRFPGNKPARRENPPGSKSPGGLPRRCTAPPRTSGSPFPAHGP